MRYRITWFSLLWALFTTGVLLLFGVTNVMLQFIQTLPPETREVLNWMFWSVVIGAILAFAVYGAWSTERMIMKERDSARSATHTHTTSSVRADRK